jgi:LPS sulfotransferase NodH
MISPDGDKLVFLFSLPRSGSTILSLLMGNHSTILCPPEPWFLLKLSALTEPGNVNSVFDDDWATIGTSEFLSEDAFLQAARAFATATYNWHLKEAQKTIFVDKTPRYYHIIEFIEALFPKAHKIWLQRDPLDVALSYVNNWGVGIDVIVGRQVTAASLDFAIGLFRLADYFDTPSPLKMELQYEAVVRDPTASLVQVCDFLGVEYEDAMLNYANNEAVLDHYAKSMVGDEKVLATSSVHRRSIGKWPTGLQVADIQQIIDLLGFEILRRMGYDGTVATLQSMGITIDCEAEAAELRRQVAHARIDKTTQLYNEVAALREGARGTLIIARILRRTRLDRLLRRVSP